eukprot:1519480-Amphidinium_carterae.1
MLFPSVMHTHDSWRYEGTALHNFLSTKLYWLRCTCGNLSSSNISLSSSVVQSMITSHEDDYNYSRGPHAKSIIIQSNKQVNMDHWHCSSITTFYRFKGKSNMSHKVVHGNKSFKMFCFQILCQSHKQRFLLASQGEEDECTFYVK